MNSDVEVWKDVVGWEGLYEVSSLSRIRSLDREVRTCGKAGNWTTRIAKGRILSQPQDRLGYQRVGLHDHPRHCYFLAHRIVATAFIPNPLNLPEINHIDGVKSNISISNLEWCTRAGNMLHAKETGLLPKSMIGPGELSRAAKLNNVAVAEIKERLFNGESCIDIAKDFSVGASAISEIKAGRSWSHVGRAA